MYRATLGGCGAGAVQVAYGRYCLLAVELDASGEVLVKPVRAQRLPDSGHHLGFPLLLQRPGSQADTPAKALGRPRQQRGPFSLTLDERQLREGGKAQGHVAGAVGRQAQLQPLVQQRPGLLGPALAVAVGQVPHAQLLGHDHRLPTPKATPTAFAGLLSRSPDRVDFAIHNTVFCAHS